MRKLTVIMLALLMVLSSATMAMAAPFDLIKADGSETHSFTDFIDSPSIFDEVANNMTEYLIEDSNGQLFRVSEVQDSLDAGAETLADAVVGLTPVEINEELTVESVSAITDVKTKVTTVTATVLNAEEDAEATVAIFAYDEEGELVEEAVVPAFEAEIDEEGKIEVEVDAVEEELDSGDYKVVVTVTQVVDEEEVTAEGEFEFELDFEAVDAAVDAVNKAGTNVALWNALQNELFEGVAKEANIVKYKEELEVPFNTVAEVIEAVKEINEEVATEGEFKALKEALEAAKDNDLAVYNILKDKFGDIVKADNIEEYIAEIFNIADEKPTTVKLESIEEIQDAIDDVNKEVADEAAADAVKTLIAKIAEIPNEITAEYRGKVEAARVAYDALTDDQKAKVASETLKNLTDAETKIKNTDAYAEAKAAVYALFKLDKDGELELENGQAVIKVGVTQAQIDAAEKLVNALAENVDTEGTLGNLIEEANTQFEAIDERLAISKVELIDGLYNSSKDGELYRLGYNVVTDVSGNGQYTIGEGEDEKPATPEDTKSIVVEFLKGDDVIGKLTFRGKLGEGKYKGQSAVSGVLDLIGDYDSTSWAQDRIADITNIPDKVRATVEYKDGWVVTDVKDVDVVVTPFFVQAVNLANTPEEMVDALVNLEAVMENGSEFMDLSTENALEVAQLVLDARAEQEGLENIANADSTVGKFFDATTNKLMTASELFEIVDVDGYTEFITEVNGAGTKSEMVIELAKENYFPEFVKLSAADKAKAAERVLNVLQSLKADEKDGFKTLTEIKAASGL